MKQDNLAIATESSCISINVTQEVQKLENQEKQIDKKLDLLAAKKFLSDEDKRQQWDIEKELEELRSRLCNLKSMERFKRGQWVHNGDPEPGQVSDFKLVATEYKVAVLYQKKGEVLERPAQLIAVGEKYLSWIWVGENYPKLIRHGDKIECDRFEVLAEEYESNQRIWKSHKECGAGIEDIEPYQKKATWCKKQYQKLTRDRFPAGTKVIVGKQDGVVKDYGSKQSPNLQLVEIDLTNGSVVKRSPVDLEFAPATRTSIPTKILEFCSRKPEIKTVAISDIRKNGGTQQRVTINHETVKEYAEAMREGDRFPPVKLRFDGTDYWLTDGFHTTEAAWSIGKTEIEAEITEGTQRDAILASVAVNTIHGLRRSNADKRKAVTTLLEDSEWQQWSDREISRRCKVHHATVAKIRKELTGYLSSDNPKKYIDKHGNESVMQTDNIGSNQDAKTANQNSSSTDKESTVQISSTDKDAAEPINDPNFPLNPYAKQLEINNLVNRFEIGQLVRISSDRTDKRLIGYNQSNAVITQINPASVNIRLHDAVIFNEVSPNDIEVISQESVTICCSISVGDYAKSILMFDKKEDIIKAAIAAKSLKL